MKNFLKTCTALLMLFTVMSCDNKPFTGYVVGKEYIEGHMCHSDGYRHIVEAIIVVPPHVNVHHHEWQESEFILHVANYEELRHIYVDSCAFIHAKMLEVKTFYPK